MTEASPRIRHLARQLLAHEAGSGSVHAPPGKAAVRVCHALGKVLDRLIGRAGYRALLERALALARQAEPVLADVTLDADARLHGLDAALRECDPSRARSAVETLLATLIGLLATFVGEALAVRLVQRAWPEVPLDLHAGAEEAEP